MIFSRVVKTNSGLFNKLESLNSFLLESGIELHVSARWGILYKYDGRYFKYNMEGSFPEPLPFSFDGNYIECDCNGNTDYYQPE